MKKIVSAICIGLLFVLIGCSANTSTGESDVPVSTESETQVTEAISTESPSTAHEHEFGDWIVVQEADYFTEGVKERSCTCGEKETEILPKKEVITAEDVAKVLSSDKWYSVYCKLFTTNWIYRRGETACPEDWKPQVRALGNRYLCNAA